MIFFNTIRNRNVSPGEKLNEACAYPLKTFHSKLENITKDVPFYPTKHYRRVY